MYLTALCVLSPGSSSSQSSSTDSHTHESAHPGIKRTKGPDKGGTKKGKTSSTNQSGLYHTYLYTVGVMELWSLLTSIIIQHDCTIY